MMEQIAGCVLLIAGGGALGWAAGERLRERTEELDGLCAGLSAMGRELEFYQTSVPDAWRVAASSARGTAAEFFAACVQAYDGGEVRRIEDAWRQGADRRLKTLAGEERGVLAVLGEVLGRYDLDTQRRALDQCCARLEAARAESREEWRRQKRLHLVLGATAGALGAVILL